MISIFGSINMDLVARVSAIARPGETVLSRRADSFFGGKGANQAVAAARAARGALDVAMVGAVGDDPFGQACLMNLRDNGVDAVGLKAVAEPTGCAFITVDESGENAITVASGANLAVRAAFLDDALLAKTSVLVLQMEVPVEESLAAARRAREHGCKVIWNFAPTPGEEHQHLIPDLLAVTDILVVNEHEAIATAALLGAAKSGDEQQAASYLAKSFGLTCVVTRGSRGAQAVLPDGTRLHAAALPVTAADTTGAGDTFVGVMAAALGEGLDLAPAMERACAAASLSCLKLGAQAGMPGRDEIERALAQKVAPAAKRVP
ncbi:ribokinase [Microvirga terricola]|uniref:Ribokinase n=1 Tax=Microvirga terricola TaxID=2719797 RepID=A0ABX0V8L3_9HYPH|nr:ribokinase [Microvirga terricola]NIX76178.1 ribokinase [Microvirga terricola]